MEAGRPAWAGVQDPQRVRASMSEIGGGVTSVGSYFYTHVQQYANEFAKGFSEVSILPAQFGVDAGVIGAAIGARQFADRKASSFV